MPLHFAVSWAGQKPRQFGTEMETMQERIDFLVEHVLKPPGKAALHYPNDDNEMPLHRAVKDRGHPKLLNVLLDGNVGAASHDVNGDLALHLALRHVVDVSIIVRLLDSYPESASKVDSLGKIPINYLVTSLHLASEEENSAAAQQLRADRDKMIVDMISHFSHYMAFLDVWRQGTGTPATQDDLDFLTKMGLVSNGLFQRLGAMIIMTGSETFLQANLSVIDPLMMDGIKATENPIRAALEYGGILGSRAGKHAEHTDNTHVDADVDESLSRESLVTRPSSSCPRTAGGGCLPGRCKRVQVRDALESRASEAQTWATKLISVEVDPMIRYPSSPMLVCRRP